MNLLTGINHVAVMTEDLDRFVDFYTDVFESRGRVRGDQPGVPPRDPAHRARLVAAPRRGRRQPARRRLPTMFDRGHLDHVALVAASAEAFERPAPGSSSAGDRRCRRRPRCVPQPLVRGPRRHAGRAHRHRRRRARRHPRTAAAGGGRALSVPPSGERRSEQAGHRSPVDREAAPVMKRAWSEQRNATTAPKSSGRRRRRPGGRRGALRSPPYMLRRRSVSCDPGCTEFTVTPSPATSRASVLRKPVTPARAVFDRIRPAIGLAHRDRRDGHDPAPALLLHRRHGGLAHGDGRQQVQLQRRRVGVEGGRREVAGRRAAGVGHEDVDAAERVGGGARRRPRRPRPCSRRRRGARSRVRWARPPLACAHRPGRRWRPGRLRRPGPGRRRAQSADAAAIAARGPAIPRSMALEGSAIGCRGPWTTPTSDTIADTYPHPYWYDDVDQPESNPMLVRTETCDLCVVGGGYTGLWTALIAKERDPSRDVVLVEGGAVGSAASGRNGGFMESSLTHGVGNGQERFAGRDAGAQAARARRTSTRSRPPSGATASIRLRADRRDRHRDRPVDAS